MISIKKPHELEKMRRAGAIAADVLMLLKEMIRPGITTAAIDQAAEDYIRRSGATPSEKGYRVPGIPTPYPASVCASVNDQVVHGIPSENCRLEDGDIVSIDVMACYEGYHGDCCYTYAVGEISQSRRDLLNITRESLDRAIHMARAGNTLGHIGHAVESLVIPAGYGLVREYSGHGIGKRPHEAPMVPNYGRPGRGITLKSGMTIAIEPMVMSGREDLINGEDGWLVSTADGSDAAHFERTVHITEGEPEILTPWED
ncbi:MAG: type I methionyl aminopeptidase [Dethiosulfovibrio peptidovorans]|nr:MAG: type I methionyl aminopeptidase [Dethiosulfovibrio peptidovorans]